jgi:two-component system sensor histidine kinase MprB
LHGAPVVNLGTRLALAFAVVAALVAATIATIGIQFAAGRVTDEVQQNLLGGQSPQWTAQRIEPGGGVTPLGGAAVVLPADDGDRLLAADHARGATRATQVSVGGDHYQVLTTGLGDGRGAVQVGFHVELSHRVVGGIAREITVLALVVTVVAAGLGWLLARRIARRLVRLTAIAEEVSAAGPAGRAVPVEGRDEVARLSSSFNTMLHRLVDAREAQERLVQDAAHELRTPLTSLRTNVSVLRRLDRLDPQSRERLLADVDGETRELSNLVDELITLALDRGADEEDAVVDLTEVVQAAAARTRRRSGRQIVVVSDGTRVRGRRAALERGVGNLMENAAKFDTSGGPIDVRVRRARIAVSDRGPGLEAEDIGRVFDRFYRAEAARALPGSGLGLAIVADVAEAHDGTTFATNRTGGGVVIGIEISAGRLLPSPAPRRDSGPSGSGAVVEHDRFARPGPPSAGQRQEMSEGRKGHGEDREVHQAQRDAGHRAGGNRDQDVGNQ